MSDGSIVSWGSNSSGQVSATPGGEGFIQIAGGGDHSVALTGEPPVHPGFVSYWTAGTSASGCMASLTAVGTASATYPSSFVLQASDVEGAKDGLFFFGSNGRQASPWGNGTSDQCVVPPVKRGGLLLGIGTSQACDGSFSMDLNALWCPTCPKPGHNPGAGTVVQAQLWYRDPWNTGNQTTSLSGAIDFPSLPDRVPEGAGRGVPRRSSVRR